MQNQPSYRNDQKQTHPLTFEEYIEIEQHNNQKYEYIDGFIEAMSGGTIYHGTICGNVFGKIWSILDDKNGTCKALNSEIKLAIETKNTYLYPDCMVVCGDVKKHDEKEAITNPIVIIEVLSKSTAAYDRGDKFFLYKKIRSLQQYILIEQDKPQIDIYTRNKAKEENNGNEENRLWEIERITGLESNLNLTSIDLVISLKSIYKDVVFPVLEDEEQEQKKDKEKE